MNSHEEQLVRRIEQLEAKHQRMFALGCTVVASFALIIFTGAAMSTNRLIQDEVKTKRLVVIDDAGIERVVISQDPKETDRMSRSCGITLHDNTGTERGGMSTFENGSVVVALDAPTGVGHVMRDRVGMKVYSNGSAAISMINNETKIPVRLISDADGGGGIEFFSYDMKAKKATVKRINFDGESTKRVSLGN